MVRLIILFLIIFLTVPLWAAPLPEGNHYFTANFCHYCKEQEIINKELEKEGYTFHTYYYENLKDQKIICKLRIKVFPFFIVVKVDSNGKRSILKLRGKQSLEKLRQTLYKEDKMAKRKWIKGAIKRPGALTRKAKAAGMTISQYCAQGDLSTRSKRQCNLWKTLRKFR